MLITYFIFLFCDYTHVLEQLCKVVVLSIGGTSRGRGRKNRS